MSSIECEEAFENMKETSKTLDSPTVRYYLEETTTFFLPTGCLADFNLSTSSLQYNENEGLSEIPATTSNPVYCICEAAGEFVQRDEFEDGVNWCEGWLGDVQIDPTQSWVEAGEGGTPSIAVRSLGRDMDSRSLGLLFQPGPGFAVSSVVSIGIHFAEVPVGVNLTAALRGCRATSVPESTPLECDTGEPTEVFSDRGLTPGEGDQDEIYFIDLMDTFLNPDWTYLLEFAYPPPLPTREAGEYDIFWTVKLPVYHPILQDPWDFAVEDTTYFQSVKPYAVALFDGWWNEPLTLPMIVFKLCTTTPASSGGCSASDLFAFKCNQWLMSLLLIVLIALLCCFIFCCWTSRGRQKNDQNRAVDSNIRSETSMLSPNREGEVCLNFVEFKTGRRWHRKGVPVSMPIKLLSFDVADMMNLPRASTSLWLRTGQRLKWCYRVGDYELDSAKDIFAVERRCNSLCNCFSIEDLFGVCIDPPAFDSVSVEQRSRVCQSARLITPSTFPQNNIKQMPQF